jgi:hypothetical protein
LSDSLSIASTSDDVAVLVEHDLLDAVARSSHPREDDGVEVIVPTALVEDQQSAPQIACAVSELPPVRRRWGLPAPGMLMSVTRCGGPSTRRVGPKRYHLKLSSWSAVDSFDRIDSPDLDQGANLQVGQCLKRGSWRGDSRQA